MKYMALWRPAPTAGLHSPDMMANMQALIQEMTQKGVLVQTGGWNPADPSTVVTRTNGHITVTDGPYAEAKEVIAGFCIMDTPTHEAAVEWTRRFLQVAGDGASEFRALH